MSIPPNGRHVKPHRRYDSTRRRAQAAETRQDILKAALRLFLEGGYTRTTINDVAAAAGVAVETIYRGFGSKAALFKGVIEAAIAGGAARAAIPPEERPVVRAMIAEQNPRRVLELHAATQPGIHERAGPLYRVLLEAASADPEVADVWNQLEAQRLTGMRRIAEQLNRLGGIRQELSVEQAGDVLWAVNSLAVYNLLVLQRAWSPERYRDWIASTNTRALLPGRRRPTRPSDRTSIHER
ncbi:MAG: TetR/AcrR family transcriptional regulator [Chloroflexi bacterium]|nr:MAG: TetR/AcrR family transcriptional regulator [Chloroflexota bacterium]